MNTVLNEDNLKNRDYFLLIDRSGSMEVGDCLNGVSRWKAAQESTLAIAKRCNEYDPDGITIIPFSSSFNLFENTTPDKVEAIFKNNSPMGSTNLVAPLQWVFENYLRDKKEGKTKANGAMVLVITDGQPDDENAVAKAISNFTKQIATREEFGISFMQVGKDEHAAKYLNRLDSHLSDEGAKLDIVNVKTFEEIEKVGLTEALIAALSE